MTSATEALQAPLSAAGSRTANRIEHEYTRAGALAYLAAWDVPRARSPRCLIAQIMRHAPYRSARRVFLIVDNGSCHRSRRAADRIRGR